MSWPVPDRTLGSILGRGISTATTGIIQSIERGRDVNSTLRFPRRAGLGEVLEELDSATVTGGASLSTSLSTGEAGLWDLALRVEVIYLTSTAPDPDEIYNWPRYVAVQGPGQLEDTRGIPFRALGLLPFRIGTSPVDVSGTIVDVDVVSYVPIGSPSIEVALTLFGAKR